MSMRFVQKRTHQMRAQQKSSHVKLPKLSIFEENVKYCTKFP